VDRGYEAGADDYIMKPFTLKTLQTRVRAALDKASRAS
jgi:DNA-binding response OmpR family regulator